MWVSDKTVRKSVENKLENKPPSVILFWLNSFFKDNKLRPSKFEKWKAF